MSCSAAAASSSSRSGVVAVVDAGVAELVPDLERDPRDLCRRARRRRRSGRRGCAPTRAARPRTAAASRSASSVEKNTPSRSPASVASSVSKPPSVHHRLHHDRAGEDQVAAPGLDPRHLAALLGRHLREALDQRVERVAAQVEALHAEGRQLGLRARPRRPGCAWSRRCRPARPPSHGSSPSVSVTCARSALRCLGLTGSAERKRSVMRTAPSGQERMSPACAAADLGELHRAAAEVERRRRRAARSS